MISARSRFGARLPASERTMVGPFIFFDQFGPARLDAARAWTCGRIRTSTSRPSPICSTARSITATASASRPGDRARRGQSDDRGQGHRPFRALARRERAPRARASTACRPGWRCPTARRRSIPRSSMCRRRPAADRGDGVSARVLMGTLVGRDVRAPPAIRRRSTPTSCSMPGRACRSMPRPTSAR